MGVADPQVKISYFHDNFHVCCHSFADTLQIWRRYVACETWTAEISHCQSQSFSLYSSRRFEWEISTPTVYESSQGLLLIKIHVLASRGRNGENTHLISCMHELSSCCHCVSSLVKNVSYYGKRKVNWLCSCRRCMAAIVEYQLYSSDLIHQIKMLSAATNECDWSDILWQSVWVHGC